MRILLNFGVTIPDSEFTTVGELNSKTLSLMGLPKRPETIQVISFEEWTANRNEGRQQPSHHVGSSSSHQPTQSDSDDDDDEIRPVPDDANAKKALTTIARNQVNLNKRLTKFEKETSSKFDQIKRYLNRIMQMVSCKGSTSTEVREPSPLEWDTDDE